MILIGYDGSPDAKAAIERVGSLFPGHDVTVLTVWEPFSHVIERSGSAFATAVADASAFDRDSEQGARDQAAEGAKLAADAGLEPTERVVARGGSIAGAVLATADEIGAEAVAVGTRGLTGVKSILLGSVSHGIVQHADVPVLVVPSEKLAARRSKHRAAVASEA